MEWDYRVIFVFKNVEANFLSLPSGSLISGHVSNYEDVAAPETSAGACKVDHDLFRPNGPMQANEGAEKKGRIKFEIEIKIEQD
jgi:hypothetical protein